MQNDYPSSAINLIKKQFLSTVPIEEIRWQEFLKENPSNLQLLIDNTVGLDYLIKHPIRIDYQKQFLRQIIEYLEKQETVSDYCCVYEYYGRLVALPANPINFKHYLLNDNADKRIVLKENSNLISDGTTGLRTWQASLALSEWILKNLEIFNNQLVLELGCGIGLTGLIVCLHCKIHGYYFTDCHSIVLNQLCENLRLNIDNFSQDPISINYNNSNNLSDNCLYQQQSFNGSTIKVFNLDWGKVDRRFCENLGHIDIILAADIVYDDELFEPLLNTIDGLFNYCRTKKFMLACTERNTTTLTTFLQLAGKNYEIEEIPVVPPKYFLWPIQPPVKIFKITPKSKDNFIFTQHHHN